MSDPLSNAWDALPAQQQVGDLTYDVSPEAAALRALFGSSAFRHLGNAEVGEISDQGIDAVDAVMRKIAAAYLFAIEAHKAKLPEESQSKVARIAREVLGQEFSRYFFIGSKTGPSQISDFIAQIAERIAAVASRETL